MALAAQSVICTQCFVRRELVPVGRNVFPGCPRYRCTRCGSEFLQPLAPGSAAVGWTLFAVFAASAVFGGLGITSTDALTNVISGVIALIMLAGLVRNEIARSSAGDAKRAHARGEGGARE